MGGSGAINPKSEDVPSSPAQDQPHSRPFQEMLPMQAYYGHGVAIPSYSGTAVTSGHAPHPYVCGTQHMMPPFMPQYPMMYSHGVYPQPPAPLALQTHSQGITPLPATTEAAVGSVPSNAETPAKGASNKDTSPTKKLKGACGLAMSTHIGDVKNSTRSTSHNGNDDTEDSSDESHRNQKLLVIKAQEEGSGNANTVERDVKPETSANAGQGLASNVSSNAGLDKQAGTLVPCVVTHSMELLMQDERALKRERRKQSNRESARRSRLRKQAEADELAVKVQALSSENALLVTEISQLTEDAEKLRRENAALLEELEDATAAVEDAPQDELDAHGRRRPMRTENLLLRIDNSIPNTCLGERDGQDAAEEAPVSRLV